MFKKLGIIFLSLSLTLPCYAERIKDIAEVAGVRSNQLVGYGLVVGLNGTGDNTGQSAFTLQSFRSMLKQFGVRIPEGTALQLRNVAAVALHSELPAFAKPGQKIDVTISSIGNATSLRGGSLLMAPLRGADGRTYAVAQGSLVSAGFGGQGADGSRITVNVPSVASIPNGAIVERPAPSPFALGHSLTFNLHHPDFTTAKRLESRINQHFKHALAHAIDASSITVSAPDDVSQRVRFVSSIENIRLRPGEAAAKIVVNSKTGTVVIGQHVKVLPAAVAHGSLTVTISEAPFVSQPTPLSEGETEVVPSSKVSINQEPSRAFVFSPGTSLKDIVSAINRVGAAPGDLVAILEALQSVGALKAELQVI